MPVQLPVPVNPKDPKNPTPELYRYQKTPGGLTVEEARAACKKNEKKVPKYNLRTPEKGG